MTTTTEFVPTDKMLETAARRLIDSDAWRCEFCDDCEQVRSYPATMTDPEDSTCPAEFDPLDGACVRGDLVYENAEVLELAREMFEGDDEEEKTEVAA